MSGFSGPLPPPDLARLASRYYPTFRGFLINSAAVPAADTLYLYPFAISVRTVVTALAIRTVSGGAASAVKAGIWRRDAGRPIGAPLAAFDTGAATTGSSTTVDMDVTDVTLEPGRYFVGLKFTGTLPTCVAIHGGNFENAAQFGMAALTNNIGTAALSVAATYADDLPTFTGAEIWTDANANGVPVVFLKT